MPEIANIYHHIPMPATVVKAKRTKRQPIRDQLNSRFADMAVPTVVQEQNVYR